MQINRSYCFYQHIFSSFPPLSHPPPPPFFFCFKCLMSVSSTCTLCTWHPRNKVKNSLLIPSCTPSATCTVCYMSLLVSSCWEFLFKGKLFLKSSGWADCVRKISLSPSGINILIILCRLKLAACAKVQECLGSEIWRIRGSEQRQRIGRSVQK